MGRAAGPSTGTRGLVVLRYRIVFVTIPNVNEYVKTDKTHENQSLNNGVQCMVRSDKMSNVCVANQ